MGTILDQAAAGVLITPNSTHEIIARCLGSLWILDGLLQFQPPAFGPEFIKNEIAANLPGQPDAMQAVINFGIHLWNFNPALFDAGVGLLQVAIGILLFYPAPSKPFRIGAWISIAWGAVVWIFGAGAGQLLTGAATFYSGAPNAVLLYVVLAATLLAANHVPARRYPQIAAAIFFLGALLQLQPVFWSALGAATNLTAATGEGPALLAVFPAYLNHALSANPVAGNGILTALLALVGAAILLRPGKASGAIAIAFLAAVWWLGQDFGGLATVPMGTATDPDTAPLVALFLIPLFVAPRPLRVGSAVIAGARELLPSPPRRSVRT